MAVTLQTLLEGIYSAIMSARGYLDTLHLATIESHFERKTIDDEFLGRTEVYVPRLVAFATSKIEGDREVFDVLEVPQFALVPISTLAIDTLEVEFEAKLSNFGVAAATEAADGETEEEGVVRRTFSSLRDVAHDIEVMVKGDSFDSAASPAKVKVTFKLQDAPEGTALLQEQMLDYLRN